MDALGAKVIAVDSAVSVIKPETVAPACGGPDFNALFETFMKDAREQSQTWVDALFRAWSKQIESMKAVLAQHLSADSGLDKVMALIEAR